MGTEPSDISTTGHPLSQPHAFPILRRFFLADPRSEISETLSRKSGNELLAAKSEAVSRKLGLAELAQAFTLPWSAYVRLLVVKDDHARQFYEVEALRGGWSVRQLDRQINSQFYERTEIGRAHV